MVTNDASDFGLLPWRRLKTAAASHILQAAALGQLCSLLLAIVGSCSEALSRQSVFLPTFQTLSTYVLLAAGYGGWLLRSGRGFHERWYKYAALALLDLEGNFLLNQAYRYTSLTSVTLLDCFTIPSVLLLSWLLLGAHYKRLHFVGASAAVSGLALLVAGDGSAAGASQPQYPHALWGDCLVLVGASLYALCNVAQEAMLCDVSNVELLAMIGLYGAGFSTVQVAVTERSALAAAPWNWQMLFPLAGYVAALVLFYSLVPRVLQTGGAAVLNLSLLSSDLWAAAARVIFFGGFSWAAAVAFLLALGLVSSGLVLFSRAGEVYSAADATTAPAPGTAPSHDEESDVAPRPPPRFRDRHREAPVRQPEELQALWSGPGDI